MKIFFNVTFIITNRNKSLTITLIFFKIMNLEKISKNTYVKILKVVDSGK